MALLTDDMDIRTTYFRIIAGGNGDYYPEIFYYEYNNLKRIDVRIAMSGGNAPTDVKLAIANLYRALEKYNLNKHPIEDENKF